MKRPFGALRRLAVRPVALPPLTPGERLAAPIAFERKSDATSWLSTVEADIARGKWIDASGGRRITVAAWSETWLSADPNKRASTVARDRQALAHFLPHLGEKALSAVSPADVQGIVARLVASQAPAHRAAERGELHQPHERCCRG